MKLLTVTKHHLRLALRELNPRLPNWGPLERLRAQFVSSLSADSHEIRF